MADQEALLASHHDVTQVWSLSQAVHVARLLDLQRVRDQILPLLCRRNIEEAENLTSHEKVPPQVKQSGDVLPLTRDLTLALELDGIVKQHQSSIARYGYLFGSR